MIHELKILPKWFEDVAHQKKTFEIRKNDRNYSVGDTLVLREWHEGKYTGRLLWRTVSYIYYGDGTYGLSDGYVVIAIRSREENGKMLDSVQGCVDFSKRNELKKDTLLEELAKEDLQVLSLAYAYAKNLQMHGGDVTKAVDSATENVAMLEKAYLKGYYDAASALIPTTKEGE